MTELPSNDFLDFKERSTQFVRAVFSAGRSRLALRRESVFAQAGCEFRIFGLEVKNGCERVSAEGSRTA